MRQRIDAESTVTAGNASGQNDGAAAMTELRQRGGRTIAEAESTSVVWGMPGELVKNGGADLVRPVDEIAASLAEWLEADAVH